MAATLLFGCGKQNQPPSPQPHPTKPLTHQANSWSEFTFPVAGYAITAPFPPDDIPYEGQPGYSQAWNWSVGNPDFNFTVVVQELGNFLHAEDAQKRIMEPAVATSMNKIGADNYSLDWLELDGRIVASANGFDPQNRRVWMRVVMANKAFYMMLAREVGDDNATSSATRLFDSFRLLPEYPTAIPDAAVAEHLPVYIDQSLNEAFDPELAAMIEDSLTRQDAPDRGLHYEGEFNQPELTPTQTARLRIIMDTMRGPNPLPWETWLHDVRIQNRPIDASLLQWGRICIAWGATAEPDWSSEFQSWVLDSLYFCESVSEEKAREFMQLYAFPQDLQDRLLLALKETSDDDVAAWFEGQTTNER